jgi:hypothetical protein
VLLCLLTAFLDGPAYLPGAMEQEELLLLLLPCAEASHVSQMRPSDRRPEALTPEALRGTGFLLSVRRYIVTLPPVA